jgi:hypothetical protein
MFYNCILHGMMSTPLIVQEKDEHYLITMTSTGNSVSAHAHTYYISDSGDGLFKSQS